MPELVPIDSDLDIAFRLILTEQPEIGLSNVVLALREQGYPVPSPKYNDLWTRYRGWDGRTDPTHDVNTGRRI